MVGLGPNFYGPCRLGLVLEITRLGWRNVEFVKTCTIASKEFSISKRNVSEYGWSNVENEMWLVKRMLVISIIIQVVKGVRLLSLGQTKAFESLHQVITRPFQERRRKEMGLGPQENKINS